MFNRLFALLLIAILASAAGPGRARGLAFDPAGLPMSESADYRLSWMQIPLGEAHISWQETADHYEIALTLRTSGVARVFRRQALTATVTGRKQADGGRWHYLPVTYHYHNQRKHKERDIRIAYDAAGGVASVSVTPPDDPAARPPVSEAGRHAAHDPLTALLAFLEAAQHHSPARFSVFDGRRLSEISAEPAPLAPKEEAAGRHAYRFARTPLEGFTTKEMERAKHDRPVTGTVTPGHSRFPERLIGATLLGSVVAERRLAPDTAGPQR